MRRTHRHPRPRLAVAISIATAVVYLASGAHYAVVGHAVCVEHGDLAHSHADAGHETPQVEVRSEGHDGPALQSHRGTSDNHGHCDLTATRTPLTEVRPAHVAPLAVSRPASMRQVHSRHGTAQRAVLSYAPKRAPPVSLG